VGTTYSRSVELFPNQVDLGPTRHRNGKFQAVSFDWHEHGCYHSWGPDLLLKKVTLYLSALSDKKLMNIVVGVENCFTAGRSDRTFESWWTHFALEVTFKDGTKRVLERTVDGVHFTAREIAATRYPPFRGRVFREYQRKRSFSFERYRATDPTTLGRRIASISLTTLCPRWS
jgi:hypothetical protein